MKEQYNTVVAIASLFTYALTASATVGPDPSDATTLLADVPSGTETYSEKISSKYKKLVKIGAGTLVLTAASSQSSETDFMGTVEIREGILETQNFYALRACSYDKDENKVRLSVSSNAQLRITFASKGQNQNAFYNVAIEGDGPDGKGAIVFNGGGSGDNLIRHLHLTGDASIGGTGRFGVGYWGGLFLDGHTLTGLNNEYYFRDIRATADHAGYFVKKGGSVTFQRGEHQTYLRGGSANTFTLDNAKLTIWSGADLEVSWTLKLLASTTIFVHGSSQWGGSIVGDGGNLDIYSDNANAEFTVGGSITNVATLRPHSSGGQSYRLNLVGDHYLGSISQNKSHVTVTGGLHQVMGSVTLVDNPCSLRFIDAGDVRLTNGESRVYASTDKNPSRLEMRGKTVVTGSSGVRLMVGDHSTGGWASEYCGYWGSLTVADGAVVSNAMHVGYRGLGAVYQRGTTAFLDGLTHFGYGSGNKNGVNAYGYWGATDSRLTLNGDLYLGYATNSFGAFVQKGGVTEHAGANLRLGYSGGNSVCYVGFCGVFRSTASGEKRFSHDSTGRSASTVFTVDGEGALADFGANAIAWMGAKDFSTYLNINNGGTFRAYRFQYEGYRPNMGTARSYLSFNGGTLDFVPSKPAGEDYQAFMPWGNPVHESYPDVCTVFGGGATICVEGTNTVLHYVCDLLKPSGRSVMSIALPEDETFMTTTHLGALRVVIEDPNGGEGASAFVAFDDVTGRPSKVVVTSPGVNYSDATTAKVVAMRGATTWDCAVTLGEITGGGFTKTGPGHLILKGNSTYVGPTTVREGILTFGREESVPQGNPLVMTGGILNFGNWPMTVSSLSGYGKIDSNAALPLTVTDKLTFSAEDVLEGRKLTLTSGPTLTFGTGTSIEIAGDLPKGDGKFKTVLFESSKPIVGNPTLVNDHEGWKLRLSADRKRIICGREIGFSIFVR